MADKVKKPVAKVIGKDGNVFNITAISAKALKDAGLDHVAMIKRVYASGSYSEALAIMQEYVEFK